MSAAIEGGPYTKSASRDSDGHREYKIAHLVRTTSKNDGPQIVMDTPGLPAIGSVWAFGNDLDFWAFCRPNMTVRIHKEKKGDPAFYWLVEQTFSSKPLDRDQTEPVEDPLLEPQKVSGNFVKYTQEISKDRHGKLLKSSSHERFRGPEVEFDFNRPAVRVEQNVALLGIATFSEMVDTVNDDLLWGLGKRKIKLSDVSWDRRAYGEGFTEIYYTRIFDFDVNFKTFDRKIPDYGTLVLKGRWTNVEDNPTWTVDAGMDKTNPNHFERFPDTRGNLKGRVLLDGNGRPLANENNPVMIDVEHYEESDFLLLGIPTTF